LYPKTPELSLACTKPDWAGTGAIPKTRIIKPDKKINRTEFLIIPILKKITEKLIKPVPP
jgi:hypothetical protein